MEAINKTDCSWQNPNKSQDCKYDPVLAVLREYAPPDVIRYYLEHGETRGQMIQRIENSVGIVECGFEE